MYLLQDQEYREGMPFPLRTVSRSVKSIMHRTKNKGMSQARITLRNEGKKQEFNWLVIIHLSNEGVDWPNGQLPCNVGAQAGHFWIGSKQLEPFLWV